MRILATAAVALLAPAAAYGQSIGDPAAGERLALEVCAQCHFVAESQPSIPLPDAPPFDVIAEDPAVTEITLRAFLQTPHRNMPDLQLTQEETDDIVSFLLSLKRRGGKN